MAEGAEKRPELRLRLGLAGRGVVVRNGIF
jgi:hypothetical protein